MKARDHHRRGLRTRFAALLVAAFPLISTHAIANPITEIFLLGDSLSDTGNTRSFLGAFGDAAGAAAGYGNNGRFSNGPVWHEYLATSLGVSPAGNSLDGGTNYAFGGARVDAAVGPSSGVLAQQAQYFADRLAGGPTNPLAEPDALYIAWAGGNDMRDLVGNSDPIQELANKLFSITGVVANLIAAGATKVLVPNLPDLGRIPEFASTANAASATAVTLAWNAGLLDFMNLLAQQTSAEIFFLDVFGVFNDLLEAPANFGFTNTVDQCRGVETFLGIPIAETECANPTQFVFWDEIHPTTAAHQLLGQAAFELLTTGNPLGVTVQEDVPAPATVFLFALGFLVIGWRRGARGPAA